MNLKIAKENLKKYFGYDSFRPMQEDIIQSIFDKKDTLVLMPTGGGKSMCFQIPAISMEGTCVVISPLISLMKDQVEGLRANGIKADFINSSQGMAEQRAVEDDLYNNNIDLLYVSPEKMVSSSFFPLLQRSKINLFAIDEAHCISSWGHDFRPEYTKLKFLKQQFPNIPIATLTATADRLTRQDIIDQMGLVEPKTFLASFDRPNIRLEVRPGQKRIEQIVEFIKERPRKAGIIYCLSRKNTEQVAAKLQGKGIKAMCYHAGMPASTRSSVQEEFINDTISVVCATVAFGMGIDKSNVRWVIHYNLPKNVEGYYQEIGRAGRDGVAAEALMFYSFRDVTVLRNILQESGGDLLDVKLAKLDRMMQLADSLICRRKILLNYFNETLEKDCGNCDVCNNPPNYFNGTIVAQKALSAIVRLRERVGIRMLIDVLRGSARKEIMEYGYDKIKTYGAGREFSFNDWQYFITQLINLGLIDMAYDQNNTLKITPVSKSVLKGERPVKLVKFLNKKEQETLNKVKFKPKTKQQIYKEELFTILQKIRRDLAQQEGVPPYIIFNDASLNEMAELRPAFDNEFRAITGVGDRKLVRYGNYFMDAIREFIKTKVDEGNKIKGSTYVLTYLEYEKNLLPEEIAKARDIAPMTVYGHLSTLYERGVDIDIYKYVSAEEIEAILKVVDKMPVPFTLTEVQEKMNGIAYHKIKFALAKAGKGE